VRKLWQKKCAEKMCPEYASISANQMDTMYDQTDSNVNLKNMAAADCSQSTPYASRKIPT